MLRRIFGTAFRNRTFIQAALRLLDTEWYSKRYPDVRAHPGAAKRHYLRKGISENRSPSPFFDAEWYVNEYHDVAEAGIPAILHYLKSGGREGRNPAPFIDAEAYRAIRGEHFSLSEFGTVFEDLLVLPDEKSAFSFFNADYYLTQAEFGDDQPQSEIALLRHFLIFGLETALSPHPLIQVSSFGDSGLLHENYRKFAGLFRSDCSNTDLKTHTLTEPAFFKRKHGDDGRHPIVRYLAEWKIGRTWIHPLFDAEYYERSNKTFDGVTDPLSHYLGSGDDAHIQPNHYFDAQTYRQRFGHTLEEGEHPLSHYMRHGLDDWAEPGEHFGQKYYLSRDKHAKLIGEPALVRFLHANEDRSLSALPPKPFLDATIGCSDLELAEQIRIAAAGHAPAKKPKVSVIIPVYENLRYTLRCVLSCYENVTSENIEIIIADDHSPDASGKWLADNLQGIEGLTVLINQKNLGFLKSCNAAARKATGDFLFFLNNDTVVLKGWLSELLDTFERCPNTGLAGSKLVYPNGLLQEAGGIIWNSGACANYGRMDDPAAPQYNFQRDVDYLSGAAIMIPNKLWQDLDGFSVEFAPAYYEDTDLAMKVRKAGYRVIYQPRSVVVHFEGISSGTDTSTGVKRYQETNKIKFFDKWEEELSDFGEHGDFSKDVVDRHPSRRILIFDADLPRPDKDSGSITAFFYNKLLSDLGFRVTFVPENLAWSGKYVKALQREGVEVVTSPYEISARNFVLDNAGDFDLFILSRATTGGEFLPLLKSSYPEKPVIFDTVDIHHLRLERQFELTGEPDIAGQAEALKNVEFSAIRNADATIVVSNHEVEYLQSELGSFPHAVLPLIYEPYQRQNAFGDRKDVAFVGGYNHPPNLDAVKYLVEDIWPHFRKFDTGAKLHIIGSHMPPEFSEYADEDVVIVGFVEDLEAYLERIRMTVAPLRYGAGVKGKIGNSLRMGVPVVGTDIAGEGMGLKDGENILLANGALSFAEKMQELYDDEAKWNQLSKNGQKFVDAEFGFEAASQTLRSLCRSLLN